MKVRRYFASNMRNALELVRQEQGPDVLILSNRKVDGGIELITTDESPDSPALKDWSRKHQAERRAARAPTGVPAAPPAPAAATNAGEGSVRVEAGGTLWTDNNLALQMQSELKGLRGLLEQQLSGLAWSQFGSSHPLRARLLRALSKTGMNPRLGRELVMRIPETLEYKDAWRRLLAVIVDRLVALDDPILRFGGRVALVGPTGVGKTTLASKLAARYSLDKGAEHVALISTDDHRLGAHQQLKAVGRLLGVTVRSVRDMRELDDCLAALADKELVLIDCPGLCPDDGRFRDLMMSIEHLAAQVHSYVVLAATTDYLALSKILAAMSEVSLAGCMITKLDEAAVLGPALSAVIEAALPVCYLSAGQQVPDDLERAVPAQLVRRMMRLASEAPAPADPTRLEQAFAV